MERPEGPWAIIGDFNAIICVVEGDGYEGDLTQNEGSITPPSVQEKLENEVEDIRKVNLKIMDVACVRI